jgi:hypothetical protein
MMTLLGLLFVSSVENGGRCMKIWKAYDKLLTLK